MIYTQWYQFFSEETLACATPDNPVKTSNDEVMGYAQSFELLDVVRAMLQRYMQNSVSRNICLKLPPTLFSSPIIFHHSLA